MKKTLAALVLALAGPSLAEAQETLPLLGGDREAVVFQHDHVDFQVRLGAYLRLSAIDGELDPDVPVDYADLFGGGVGGMIEASFLWDAGQEFLSGFYLSLGGDTYEGERDTDPFGDTLEADDMSISTFLVGFKGIFPFYPFWHGEFHVGLGIATYQEVEGVLTLSGVPQNVVIFDESSVLALDLGGRFGFDQPHFFAEAGFGLRFQGAPDNGDIDFDSTGPFEFAFEIGAGVRF